MLSRLLRHTRNNYIQLDAEERLAYHALPVYLKTLFELYIAEPFDTKEKLQAEREQIKYLSQKLQFAWDSNGERGQKLRLMEAENKKLKQKLKLAKRQKAAAKEKLSAAKEKEKDEVQKLSDELQALKNSKSYQIGRALTWIPRKIRKAIKAVINI